MRSRRDSCPGWVRGEDYDACARYANACGALVVSRHGCAPAMPTRVELDYFIANAERIPRPDQDATLTRLHRVTAPRTPRDEVLAFAFDHRNQFFDLAQQAGADEARIPRAEAALRRGGRRNRNGARAAGSRRHPVRRPLRPGRAQRRDRPRLVDRPAGRIAGLESGRVRSRPLDRHDADRLAARARRQVPRAVPSRTMRSTTASSRKRRSARCTTPCRRAATSCCSRSFRRSRCRARRTPCYRAMKRLYNLEHLSRSGGSSSRWTPAQWQRDRRADRRARSALPRRGAARAQRAGIETLAKGFRDARGSATCRGFAVGRTIFQEPARAVARRRDRRRGADARGARRISRR